MAPIAFLAAWAPRDVQEDPSGWGDPWGSLGDPLKSVGVLGCSWGGPWGSSGDPLGAPRVLGGLLGDPLGVSWPPEGLKGEVSKFQSFKVSSYYVSSFKVSSYYVSKFQSVKVSKFQRPPGGRRGTLDAYEH